jgi:hypothetical protein
MVDRDLGDLAVLGSMAGDLRRPAVGDVERELQRAQNLGVRVPATLAKLGPEASDPRLACGLILCVASSSDSGD